VTLGARIPKGVLLFGSPGCGKTLMARAVAGEAGVPFISIGGSEFVEVFVGVGASRVRELFDQAKKNAPCIVFVDEIDAVGGQRTPAIGGGQEHNQTLNQLLKEMDGFDQNTNVVVIAATNRPEMLDPALLRSGRFDRRVAVDRPDIIAREQIFEVHVRGKPLGDDVDLKKLAKATPGLTGADIENAVNEAAILAARFGKLAIGMAEFREGILKSVIGPERRSRTISKSEKRTIAYHEAGHAIAMHFTEGQDPIQKISVISRGFSLGFTMPVPEEDRNLLSKGHAFGEIVGLLGGRAAEELVFGKDLVTSGASNDLQRATDNARRMVTEWGMGEFVGLRSLVSPPGSTGMENLMRGERTVSEELSRQVDEEIKLILGKAYEQAYKTLVDHRDRLEAVVARLLEIETLEREEFLALVSNGS
ncbi:MAG: ATP-dependent zinc metalloprotease FtsH, partial [Patescibacteria group bacterium]